MVAKIQRRALLGLVPVALAGTMVLSGCGSSASVSVNTDKAPSDTIVVGSANFTENVIIANIYVEALKANGFKTSTKLNIGSREAYIPALKAGTIGVIPDYTGNLLGYLDKTSTASSSAEVDAALTPILEKEGLVGYKAAEAQDSDAIVVTAETAQKWNLKTIADLAAHNNEVNVGGPPEFKTRVYGLPGLKEKYNLEPASFVSISDTGGPLTVKALVEGTVQAADIFTTTPAIKDNNFVVLEDPKNNFAAQNVVPIVNKSVASAKLQSVLEAVSGHLTTEDLIELNGQVSGDKKIEPADAAKQWVAAKGLDKPIA